MEYIHNDVRWKANIVQLCYHMKAIFHPSVNVQ